MDPGQAGIDELRGENDGLRIHLGMADKRIAELEAELSVARTNMASLRRKLTPAEKQRTYRERKKAAIFGCLPSDTAVSEMEKIIERSERKKAAK